MQDTPDKRFACFTARADGLALAVEGLAVLPLAVLPPGPGELADVAPQAVSKARPTENTAARYLWRGKRRATFGA